MTAKSITAKSIIAYEEGELNREEILHLFSHLVKTGLAWSLQGHYERTAHRFIVAGYLSKEGDIIDLPGFL